MTLFVWKALDKRVHWPIKALFLVMPIVLFRLEIAIEENHGEIIKILHRASMSIDHRLKLDSVNQLKRELYTKALERDLLRLETR